MGALVAAGALTCADTQPILKIRDIDNFRISSETVGSFFFIR
jgi:hypothetical protein